MRCATSLQTPHAHQYDHVGDHHREGRNPIGCARMADRWAGESSRKPRSPRPYSRRCGDINARRGAPRRYKRLPPPICACAPLRHRMRIPYAPHTSYLRETLRFLSRRGMGREGTRGWAGNSRPAPTAPPLPRAQWPISKIDRNVIFFCKPYINAASL